MSNLHSFIRHVACMILVVFLGSAYAAPEVTPQLAEKLARATPADVKVIPPASDVPAPCAAYSGQWGPSVMPLSPMAVKIIFENIAPDCTAKILIVYAHLQEFPNYRLLVGNDIVQQAKYHNLYQALQRRWQDF